jgi:fatty acid desaturase
MNTMGLFEQTLLTSRNTTGLFFNNKTNNIRRRIFNEVMGFLSMQIEHHLVPIVPSGNLMILRPYVQQLAKKYNLPYKESSVVEALWDNMMKLVSSDDQYSNSSSSRAHIGKIYKTMKEIN